MDIGSIDNSFKPKMPAPDKINKDCGFKQIFEQKITEVNTPSMPTSIRDKVNIVEKSDNILNLLDEYAKELVNPAKTLKDIKPLVERIENEVSLIVAEGKTHNDKELEKLVNDLTVAANVAVLKFHRGDYI